jgi:hypothetical protein
MSMTDGCRLAGVVNCVDRVVKHMALISVVQSMGCTVLSAVSLDYHQHEIRHCDGRWLAPGGFDDTHPSAAATMLCMRGTTTACMHRRPASQQNLWMEPPSICVDRTLALWCVSRGVYRCRYCAVSYSSANQAVRHLSFIGYSWKLVADSRIGLPRTVTVTYRLHVSRFI